MCHLSFKQWNAFISISNIPYLWMQRGIRGSRQTENWFSTAVCDLNAKYSVVSVPHRFFSLWCSCWDCDRFKVLSSFPLLAFWMVLGCQLNLLAVPWGCCLHLRDRSGWEQHWRQDAAAGPYGICGLNYQIGSQVLNWGNKFYIPCALKPWEVGKRTVAERDDAVRQRWKGKDRVRERLRQIL